MAVHLVQQRARDVGRAPWVATFGNRVRDYVASHAWATTSCAAIAALAVCVVAVFWTPMETPVAWRSDTVVTSTVRGAEMPARRLD